MCVCVYIHVCIYIYICMYIKYLLYCAFLFQNMIYLSHCQSSPPFQCFKAFLHLDLANSVIFIPWNFFLLFVVLITNGIAFIVFPKMLFCGYMELLFESMAYKHTQTPQTPNHTWTNNFSPFAKHKVSIKIIRVYMFVHSIPTRCYSVNLNIQINKSALGFNNKIITYILLFVYFFKLLLFKFLEPLQS